MSTCARWHTNKQIIDDYLGAELTPNNVIRKITSFKKKQRILDDFLGEICEDKKDVKNQNRNAVGALLINAYRHCHGKPIPVSYTHLFPLPLQVYFY